MDNILQATCIRAVSKTIIHESYKFSDQILMPGSYYRSFGYLPFKMGRSHYALSYNAGCVGMAWFINKFTLQKVDVVIIPWI